jgi:hypothetical protein
MNSITVVVGGVEYTGLPLTLDALEKVRTAKDFDIATLKAFLEDDATSPRPPGSIRAYPGEVVEAVKCILGLSGLGTPGDKPPGEAAAGG